MNNNGFWKIGFLLISFIFIIIVAGGAYLFGRGDFDFGSIVKTSSPKVDEQKILVTPTPNMQSEIEAIKNAVYKKTGLTSQNSDVSVSQYSSKFAKGGVKEKEAVGGAYFIAAKVEGEWICVYDGQSQPSCEVIELYNFPVEMVPECLSEANKVVKR
jgi:hypothetical protein